MSSPSQPCTTERRTDVSLLLIGNELLSGKIRDENGYFITKFLRVRGLRLREIAVVADDIGDIGEHLMRQLSRSSIVFTSGGVGPTHDDVTIEAVSRATGRQRAFHPAMEAALKRTYKSGLTDEAREMANLPQGTALRGEHGWPALRLDIDQSRIYILPGVPSLFRSKLEGLAQIDGELPSAAGWAIERWVTPLEESVLARHLNSVVQQFPNVDIGSYPKWHRTADNQLRGEVEVTFEAKNAHIAEVREARSALIELAKRES